MKIYTKKFFLEAYFVFLIYGRRILTILFRSFITPQVKFNVMRNILKCNFLAKLWRVSGLCFLNLPKDFMNMNKSLFIIQYQMGKVGSTTMKNSLEALGIPVYHTHWLNKKRLKQHLKNKQLKNRSGEFHTLLDKIAFLHNRIEKGLDREKWKIISLVREPVARNVSAFFHHMELWFPLFIRKYKTNQMTCENLRDFFLKNYYRHYVPLTWFDREMKQVFKIDVYSEEFPKSRGYKIYKGNRLDLLLIKLEKLNDCASEAIKEVLRIDGVILRNTNLAKDKPYYPLYQKFISSKILPRSYVEKMYSSKFAKHFYSEEELNLFRKKWLQEIANEAISNI